MGRLAAVAAAGVFMNAVLNVVLNVSGFRKKE
jgi:hypothetical protein